MANVEKPAPFMSSSSLLKDLHEKKLGLRKIANEVGSMATELRDVRSRMAAQESKLDNEVARRQAAESKAQALEKEIELLHKNLDEKNACALSTSSVAEQYLKELVDIRAKYASAQEAADMNAAASAAAQLQCQTFLKEIEMKKESLQEHELSSTNLSQQIADLQQQIRVHEISEMQLKNEIVKLQSDLRLKIPYAKGKRDAEVMKALEALTARNAQHLQKLINVKDEEIARLREEIKLKSAQLKTKGKELELQMERHRAVDQDLKKRVVKLEFWLQEARMQARKLQRIAERREKELNDLRAQLFSEATNQKGAFVWDSPKFKIIISVSVVALVFWAKR